MPILRHSSAIGRNFAVVASAYVILVLTVQFALRLQIDLLMLTAEVLAGATGMLLAWRFNARVAAYIVGAALAYSIPVAVLRLVFGWTMVQGRENHWAVLSAAALGVLFGAWNTLHAVVPRRPAPTGTDSGAA